MGGLLRSPKPTADVAAQPAPVAVAAAPAEVSSSAEQATDAARAEARERVRRSLTGTIATTDRGLLGVLPTLPTMPRKTLLGH